MKQVKPSRWNCVQLVIAYLSFLLLGTQVNAGSRSSLQNEINTCIAAGQTVCVLQDNEYFPDAAGTPNENRNVTISQVPAGGLTIRAPFVSPHAAASPGQRARYQARVLNRIVLIIQTSGVRIEGLRFQDNGSVQNPQEGNAVIIEGSNNTILNCTFRNMFADNDNGGAVIKVGANGNFQRTDISGNLIEGWGNGKHTVHPIKIGAERLQYTGTYIGYPEYTGTMIRHNTITGFNPNSYSVEGSNQSDAIQVYNPTVVTRNVIEGSVNGISVKGNRSVVSFNTVSGITRDGALYMRDGNQNIFRGNKVFNSASGFWLWSSRGSQFIDNYFYNVTRLGAILAAGHTGTRSANWSAVNEPLPQSSIQRPVWQNNSFAGYASGTGSETSYQFTADETLFVNNSFDEVSKGIEWFLWVPADSHAAPTIGSQEKPSSMYFINNLFKGSSSQNVRFFMRDYTPPANPSSIHLYNNAFAENAYGDVPANLLANANNSYFTLNWRKDTELTSPGSTLDPASANYGGPYTFAATPGNNQVRLDWSYAATADSFHIFRWGGGAFVRLISVSGQAVAYVDDGSTHGEGAPQNGIQYAYALMAVTNDAQQPPSPWKWANPQATLPSSGPVPGTYTVTPTPGDSQVRLDWTYSSTAKGFNIFRRPAGGQWVYLGWVQNQNEYVDNGSHNHGAPQNGSQYGYLVRATYNDAELPFSSEVLARPQASASSSYALTATPGNNQVRLDGTYAGSTYGFGIFRDGIWIAYVANTSNPASFEYTDRGSANHAAPQNGTEYRYQVEAYQQPRSQEVRATPVAGATQPGGGGGGAASSYTESATPGNNQVRLTGTYSGSASTFELYRDGIWLAYKANTTQPPSYDFLDDGSHGKGAPQNGTEYFYQVKAFEKPLSPGLRVTPSSGGDGGGAQPGGGGDGFDETAFRNQLLSRRDGYGKNACDGSLSWALQQPGNLAELRAACISTTPLWIDLSRMPATTYVGNNNPILLTSKKVLDGSGAVKTFTGSGFRASKPSGAPGTDIILHNLVVKDMEAGNSDESGRGIVFGRFTRVWLDHVTVISAYDEGIAFTPFPGYDNSSGPLKASISYCHVKDSRQGRNMYLACIPNSPSGWQGALPPNGARPIQVSGWRNFLDDRDVPFGGSNAGPERSLGFRSPLINGADIDWVNNAVRFEDVGMLVQDYPSHESPKLIGSRVRAVNNASQFVGPAGANQKAHYVNREGTAGKSLLELRGNLMLGGGVETKKIKPTTGLPSTLQQYSAEAATATNRDRWESTAGAKPTQGRP